MIQLVVSLFNVGHRYVIYCIVKTMKVKGILLRRLKSIPLTGLKVGGFHFLETTSTPIFIDYVVNKIVNLLVTL